MPVITKCPNPACEKEIGIDETSLGMRVMCPFCKTQFVAEANDADKSLAETGHDTRELTVPVELPHEPAAASPPRKASLSTSRRASSRRAGASRSAAHKPAAAKPRPAARRDPEEDDEPVRHRPEPNPMAGTIRIISASLVVILVVLGVILLANRFSASLAVASPQEAVLKLQMSIKERDEKTLKSLMAEYDINLAQAKREEFRKYLRATSGLSDIELARKTPYGLLMETLKTPEFNVDKWKFRSIEAADDSGELIVEDKVAGRSFGIRMAKPKIGWRLKLAEFCLERIEFLSTVGTLPAAGEVQPPQPAGGNAQPQ